MCPSQPIYFGTYTKRSSRGIYACEFSLSEGKLGAPRLVAETPDPSFLALHPGRKILYAANELRTYSGRDTGTVSAFRIGIGEDAWESAGRCETDGASPCHLAVAGTENSLIATNYRGASVACIALRDQGELTDRLDLHLHAGQSVDPVRQASPHPHSVHVDPVRRRVWVADLGIDQLVPYRIAPTAGRLALDPVGAISLPPGTGPRQLAFHPGGRHFFLLGELNASLTVFQMETIAGAPRAGECVSIVGDDCTEMSAAEVAVHPSGRFVYASNRGVGSIAVFDFAAASGRLTRRSQVGTGGKLPRHFALSPDGKWLVVANQDNDVVRVFSVGPDTGALEVASECAIPEPTCVIWGDSRP
ncbi:MAG: lactonase family protein [Opitutaceae bacterium]